MKCVFSCPMLKKSGVVHLAISDHALVYMTHKAKYECSGARKIKTRHMKNLKNEKVWLPKEPTIKGVV